MTFSVKLSCVFVIYVNNSAAQKQIRKSFCIIFWKPLSTQHVLQKHFLSFFEKLWGFKAEWLPKSQVSAQKKTMVKRGLRLGFEKREEIQIVPFVRKLARVSGISFCLRFPRYQLKRSWWISKFTFCAVPALFSLDIFNLCELNDRFKIQGRKNHENKPDKISQNLNTFASTGSQWNRKSAGEYRTQKNTFNFYAISSNTNNNFRMLENKQE